MKKWGVLTILATSMFIIVIDTTIMNVSISYLVEDLNTTVSGVQAAVSLYALVMASFILTGGKLSDYLGKKRVFTLGLILFGIGTTIASFSQSLLVLIIGWSVIEGLGSALMLPNTQTILRVQYKGKDRAFGYGVIGAVGAVGAAAGPIIGGFLTTYFSWRWAFRLEVLIVILVLVFIKIVPKDSKFKSLKEFDFLAVFYAVISMSGIVLGTLLSQTYGWWLSKAPLQIGDLKIEPFGLSVVPFIFGIGVYFTILLMQRVSKMDKENKISLFKISTLKSPGFIPTISTRFIQMGITAGLLFVFPLFLQLTFNYSAIKTGLSLLPFSFATLLFAIAGSRFSQKYSPKKLIKVGFISTTVGFLGMVLFISSTGVSSLVAISTIFLGMGVGLISSQLVNLALSTVSESDTSEASGLNGTVEQLGNALGVALVGGILLSTLTLGLGKFTSKSIIFSADEKVKIESVLQSGVQLVSDKSLNDYLAQNNVDGSKAQELVKINSTARLNAFKSSMLFMAFLSFLSLLLSRSLPDIKI